ncbi:DUF924 domain-containing protein [Altererythrobacter sp. CC-YST694]|uniref:DUF924 family protein n=1 Tax=Altererythrobacter sp. CC-YST694 TaxID=2755038 RepID=UPI001D02B6A1|nr:DUF924 family protein [Altererythrobacter sp. CC-YST694]MCB5425212.1 DUF924 domain-containing protein [Altererythrobacter sp. CC-YST694]
MAAAPRRWAAELLHFWFHTLGPRDWFGGGPEVDEALRRRFEPDLLALFTQSADNFLTDPLTARAAVLLFDQLPRNLYRGTAEAFAFDPLAHAICVEALSRGWDRGLTLQERQFLGLPLMHGESRADQLASLAYYGALGNAFILSFARAHYRMVARFRRFPHRNEVLGRKSTPAELAAIAAGNHW